MRELENEVERAVALADDDGYVTPDLLSPKLGAVVADGAPMSGSLRAAVEGYESQLIREALGRNDGNQTRTAAELGLSRRAFIDKLAKYHLR